MEPGKQYMYISFYKVILIRSLVKIIKKTRFLPLYKLLK